MICMQASRLGALTSRNQRLCLTWFWSGKSIITDLNNLLESDSLDWGLCLQEWVGEWLDLEKYRFRFIPVARSARTKRPVVRKVYNKKWSYPQKHERRLKIQFRSVRLFLEVHSWVLIGLCTSHGHRGATPWDRMSRNRHLQIIQTVPGYMYKNQEIPHKSVSWRVSMT